MDYLRVARAVKREEVDASPREERGGSWEKTNLISPSVGFLSIRNIDREGEPLRDCKADDTWNLEAGIKANSTSRTSFAPLMVSVV